MNQGFDHHLAEIARSPVLLVASDYDGTLAPIVPNPEDARPLRELQIAIRRLAEMSQTHVAIISGRSLHDLARMTQLPDDVYLVGSHGSEFDLGFATALTDRQVNLRQAVLEHLREIASRSGGAALEEKPASVAFHYRKVPEEQAQDRIKEILKGPASLEGVHTKIGKKVIELSVVSTNKGDALHVIRRRVGATNTIFFGDDKTDEDAFATLSGSDMAVKVGDGETAAPYRVADPYELARVLARLCELRTDWLLGAQAVEIRDHAMLSDQRTMALITPEARVTWLCVPRIDSEAVFAELLGGTSAGYFAISCAHGRKPIQQRFVDHSLILETSWPDFSVTDFLDCADGRPGHRAGRTELIRIIRGTGRIRLEFAPRLDYGRVPTRLCRKEGGLILEDTIVPVVLRSPNIDWKIRDEGRHQTAHAELDLGDQPVVLELCHGRGSLHNTEALAMRRLGATQRFWSQWAESLVLPRVESESVRRSALILKGLCYGPTGAIAAAATTSLPEEIGGVRNWDYRYCWIRDAALSASALVQLGSNIEAMEYLDWLLGVLDECESPARLSPLYAVTGESLGSEAEIGELSGYRGSRPVRIGNSASRQVQLDVFGPVVDLISILLDQDAPLSSEHWRIVELMVTAVAERWHEPDHGIWEIRKARRHHVHSKVMCWLTVDRAIRISRGLLDRDQPQWEELRQVIAQDILDNGFKDHLGAFTAAYDGDDLDAATLWIGLGGLLPPDDARFSRTLELIERELLEGSVVYRYLADDGLPGEEGGFLLCTSWLIESLILVGRLDDAQRLLSEYAHLAGPTGTFSEEFDPIDRVSLGNAPQAYSHLGLIKSAIRLSRALDAAGS